MAAGLPEPEFHFEGFFSIVLKRIHLPEKAIAVSLNVSPKRLERMMYLLGQLQTENVLNIKEAAIKYGILERIVRKDLSLLEKQGWILSRGTTSDRVYQLSENATQQLNVQK